MEDRQEIESNVAIMQQSRKVLAESMAKEMMAEIPPDPMEPEQTKYRRLVQEFESHLLAEEEDVEKGLEFIQAQCERENSSFEELFKEQQETEEVPKAFLSRAAEVGWKMYDEKRLGEARMIFSMLRSLAPDFAGGWIGLAIVYSDLRQPEQAFEAIFEAVRAFPYNCDLYELLVDLGTKCDKKDIVHHVLEAAISTLQEYNEEEGLVANLINLQKKL